MQLVVGEDEMSQVHQPLEVGVVQDSEAVGVQVEGVKILEVSKGVRPDLADGVPAEGQVDLCPEKTKPNKTHGQRYDQRFQSTLVIGPHVPYVPGKVPLHQTLHRV